MSRVDMKVQMALLKEARVYFKNLEPVSKLELEQSKAPITLTKDHLVEWLEVFYDDKIKMDTCNEARVRR